MMKTINHKDILLDIYDRYGLVDIRTETTNRSAQICRCDETWETHLYWNENGLINRHNVILTSGNKEKAVDKGKEWVVNGQH